MEEDRRRFLPRRAPIDGYGAGGFRFADMSHRGSILCLPSGMHAWPVDAMAGLTEEAIAPIVAEAGEIDLLLIGTGAAIAALAPPLRQRLRESGIGVDVMPTSAAAMTWNVLLAEDRRVAAALIAAP